MRVLNRSRVGEPPGSVYVGRPSKYGNPFQIGTHGTRDEVIDRYEMMLRLRPDLVAAAKQELRGLDLVCWCAPKRCHADILLRVANS